MIFRNFHNEPLFTLSCSGTRFFYVHHFWTNCSVKDSLPSVIRFSIPFFVLSFFILFFFFPSIFLFLSFFASLSLFNSFIFLFLLLFSTLSLSQYRCFVIYIFFQFILLKIYWKIWINLAIYNIKFKKDYFFFKKRSLWMNQSLWTWIIIKMWTKLFQFWIWVTFHLWQCFTKILPFLGGALFKGRIFIVVVDHECRIE